MKKSDLIFSIVLIIILICCSKETKEIFTEIPFTTHKRGYFLVNTFEIDSPGSFFVIHDTAAFNKVIRSAATMDTTINWIYPYYFNDSMVIAVYKRFKDHQYKIEIKKISRNDEIIRVDYDYYIKDSIIRVSKTGDIVMIEKQPWDKVNFYENGEFIKQVTEPFH